MTNKDQYKTTCCYCGVGCGIVVNKDSQGRITVEGDKDHPVNKGMLCSKGMNLHYTVMDKSDRLLYPEMRYCTKPATAKGFLGYGTWKEQLRYLKH